MKTMGPASAICRRSTITAEEARTLAESGLSKESEALLDEVYEKIRAAATKHDRSVSVQSLNTRVGERVVAELESAPNNFAIKHHRGFDQRDPDESIISW